MYGIPYIELNELGVSVLEFHPPAHGRSSGQMTMARALRCFEWLLAHFHVRGPVFVLGHSAGANAVMQYANRFGDLKPRAAFFVQPVFEFRHSAQYMYRNGFQTELIAAISKWVTDVRLLTDLLSTEQWLDREHWDSNELRHRIDKISQGILLGEFLEDFYLHTHDVSGSLASFGGASLFVSMRDHWYDPKLIVDIADYSHVPYTLCGDAEDHYFRSAWPSVWSKVIPSIHGALTS